MNAIGFDVNVWKLKLLGMLASAERREIEDSEIVMGSVFV